MKYLFGGFNGCRTWVVSKEFQCSGDGDEIIRTPNNASVGKTAKQEAVIGKYQYNAGELAREHGCEPPSVLTQNPPVEMYQTSCSGSHYVIKCEWNKCRVVQ